MKMCCEEIGIVRPARRECGGSRIVAEKQIGINSAKN